MIKDQIKNGLVHGLVFFLTISFLSIGYAAITNIWTDTGDLEVNSSSVLTSTGRNSLLGNFEYLKTKTENIYGNAGKVGIGTTSPGQVLTVAGTIESTTGGFKFPDGSVQSKAIQGIVTIRTNTSMGNFSLAHGGSASYSASCLAGEVAVGGGCFDGGYKDFYYWEPGVNSYTCAWYNTSGTTRTYNGAKVYVSCLK